MSITPDKTPLGGLSRRRLLALTGASAAATLGLAACEGKEEERGTSQFGEGDTAILNYALTLEHLEAAFYRDVLAQELFQGSDLETLSRFAEEEAEHVAELSTAIERIGGDPTTEPSVSFRARNAESALEIASKIENLAAAAILGQVPNVADAQVLETLLSIHSVEGRHAATVDVLLGRPFTPDGDFAKPASAKVVLGSIEPFMVS